MTPEARLKAVVWSMCGIEQALPEAITYAPYVGVHRLARPRTGNGPQRSAMPLP